MNLYFDLDTGVFCSGPGSRDTVSSLSFKRGDTVSLAVRFISGIIVQELGVGATGKLGLKESGEYDADFVASDTAWTKTGTGTSTVYTFELNLNTSELNALLGHDGTEGNDVASVDLMMEMEWAVDGVTTSSNTITATVRNDVVKGSEGTALTQPSPDEWLEERQAALLLSSGTPTSPQYRTWRSAFVNTASADGTATFTVISELLATPVEVTIAVTSGEQIRSTSTGSFNERAIDALNANSELIAAGIVFSLIAPYDIRGTLPDLPHDRDFNFGCVSEVFTSEVNSAYQARQIGQGNFIGQRLYVETPGRWYSWDGTAWEADASTILTALGIPTYVDLTAANAALPIDTLFWNEATGTVAITTA